MYQLSLADYGYRKHLQIGEIFSVRLPSKATNQMHFNIAYRLHAARETPFAKRFLFASPSRL